LDLRSSVEPRGGLVKEQQLRPSHRGRSPRPVDDLALDLAKDCAASYRKARPDVRKMWNRAFFQTIHVREGAIADFKYEEPFASLLASHKGSIVVLTGFEPVSPP
jgi:hypothetical protein